MAAGGGEIGVEVEMFYSELVNIYLVFLSISYIFFMFKT